MYECVALALTGQSSAKSQFVSVRFLSLCFNEQPSESFPCRDRDRGPLCTPWACVKLRNVSSNPTSQLISL